MKISDLIKEKSNKEKADIKGQEIAKIGSVVRQNVKFSGADYDIEIVSMNPIEGGVEVFARAWDANGQIGFGKDGTVNLERFVIVNPPILVDDPNGDIIREYIEDRAGQLPQTKQLKLREDPKEALLQSLAHTISLIEKGKPRGKIVLGKVGNTTLTAYPNTGSGTAPMDVNVTRVVNDGIGQSFTGMNAGAGTQTGAVDATVESNWNLRTLADTDTDNFAIIHRGIWGFDTSSIGTNNVDSAIFSHWATTVGTGLGNTDAELVSATPADEAIVAAGDYTNVGSTRLATGKAISTMSTGVYTDWTLNATGLTNIDKTGNTYMAGRTKWELDNSFGGTWAAPAETVIDMRMADFAGTTSDPKLVVEHSAAAAASQWLLMGV